MELKNIRIWRLYPMFCKIVNIIKSKLIVISTSKNIKFSSISTALYINKNITCSRYWLVMSPLTLLTTAWIGRASSVLPVMFPILEMIVNHNASLQTVIRMWTKKDTELCLNKTSQVRKNSGLCWFRCVFSISERISMLSYFHCLYRFKISNSALNCRALFTQKSKQKHIWSAILR